MKRILIIVLVIVSNLYVGLAFSQEKTDKKSDKDNALGNVLIDFGQYEELNSKEGSPYLKEKPKDWEKNTNQYLITQEDMSLSNWIVELNSSASKSANKNNSYVKKVQTKGGETVLGVRIHYPDTRYNAYAQIKPFYEIMEYNKEGSFSNVGNGVLDNVGVLKTMSVEVAGRNIGNGLYIRLMDAKREYHDFFMGYLNFVGWRRLFWTNPHYIKSVIQREHVRQMLYPQDRPYLKFHSFLVGRVNNDLRGDFVVYFKKVQASYDNAVISTEFLDVDDEKIWGIERHRALLRQARERVRLSSKHFLVELEKGRQKESRERSGVDTTDGSSKKDANK